MRTITTPDDDQPIEVPDIVTLPAEVEPDDMPTPDLVYDDPNGGIKDILQQMIDLGGEGGTA